VPGFRRSASQLTGVTGREAALGCAAVVRWPARALVVAPAPRATCGVVMPDQSAPDRFASASAGPVGFFALCTTGALEAPLARASAFVIVTGASEVPASSVVSAVGGADGSGPGTAAEAETGVEAGTGSAGAGGAGIVAGGGGEADGGSGAGAGEGAGTGGGGASGAGAGVGATRAGSSERGSTYVSVSPTRIPR
jgi:hypothetical protein